MVEECACFPLHPIRIVTSGLPMFVSSYLLSKEVEDVLKSDQILHFVFSLHCLLRNPLQCEPAVYRLHKQLKVVILVLRWPVKAQQNEGCRCLWRQLLQCNEECFDSGASFGHDCEVVVVVTGIRSRSIGSGSRSMGLWHDQGGSHVPATWCAGRMGHGLIWVISMGVKSSKTGH